mmetsp:Transcript_7246/g.12180  ORF Transcript_7246/g.12180 Transcript_7246/m.12180 type:complete len:109 (-) Transcript_7246:371-697(-)
MTRSQAITLLGEPNHTRYPSLPYRINIIFTHKISILMPFSWNFADFAIFVENWPEYPAFFWTLRCQTADRPVDDATIWHTFYSIAAIHRDFHSRSHDLCLQQQLYQLI